MSKEKHSDRNWRDRVREHDFGYDADAWQQMEKLLDGAPPPGGGGGPAPGLGAWLPWLGGALLIGVVVAVVLLPGSEKGTSGILPEQETGTLGILPESNSGLVAETKEKAGDSSRTRRSELQLGQDSDLASGSSDLRSESSFGLGTESDDQVADSPRTWKSGLRSEPGTSGILPEQNSDFASEREEQVADSSRTWKSGLRSGLRSESSLGLWAESDDQVADSSRTWRSEPRMLDRAEAAVETPDTLRPKSLELKPPVFRRWHPNLKVGVNARGFENNLLLGLGVDYRLNEKWSIGVDVHYKRWEQTPFSTFLSDTTASPSGTIIETFTDTVRRMEFAEFPLLLQYEPSPRFRLQGGLSVSLVSNQARERQTYSDFSGGWSSYGGSVSEGIRRTDVGIILGGRVYFTRELALEARYVQGLFDLTYDEWYKNQRTDLNSSFQLTLRIFL